MDDGQARKVSLNGPLVEQAQATLARMRVAERAYTLLKSEAHNAAVEDWIASQRGGPDMALVFEAANGANLDTVRVPGFFTYEGFYAGLLAHLQTIRDKLQKDNWVLGASGDQNAVQQQYRQPLPRHPRALRPRFHRRLDVGDQQPATEAAAQRQAEISEAERRLGADLAHSSDLRIHSRRDGVDPRAAEAAGAEGPGADQAKQAAIDRSGQSSWARSARRPSTSR